MLSVSVFGVWKCNQEARLAQSVERKALNLVVVGSSPTVGASFCFCLLPPYRGHRQPPFSTLHTPLAVLSHLENTIGQMTNSTYLKHTRHDPSPTPN